MAVTHLDLDLSRLTFTDTGSRYVEAASGSLVSTTKAGRVTFVGSIGTRTVFIYNPMQLAAPGSPPGHAPGQIHNVAGMTYFGGVDYSVGRWVDLSITAGQDVEVTQYKGSAELMRFVRMDARFHLL